MTDVLPRQAPLHRLVLPGAPRRPLPSEAEGRSHPVSARPALGGL